MINKDELKRAAINVGKMVATQAAAAALNAAVLTYVSHKVSSILNKNEEK